MNYKSLFLIGIAILSGCGSDDSQDSNSLEGIWAVECTVDTDGISLNGNYEFRGNRMLYNVLNYSDTSCVTEYFKGEMEVFFNLGDEIVLNSGETVFQFHGDMRSLHVAFMDDAVLSAFSEQQFCGYSLWSAGVSQDVTNCEAFSNLSSVLETQIVSIDDNVLRFGDSEYVDLEGYPARLDSEFAVKVE